MKKIKQACLNQTILFKAKERITPELTAADSKAEYENYKRHLQTNGIVHNIVSETAQEDGSILVQVKRQYNHHDSGDYIHEM